MARAPIFHRRARERIAKGIRKVEGLRRHSDKNSRRLLPVDGGPSDEDQFGVIIGIPSPNERLLLIWGVVANDSDPWDGGHVWDAEETSRPATPWPGLRGRDYGKVTNRMLWYTGKAPVEGETVPDSAHVLSVEQRGEIEYVIQFFRFSIPNEPATGPVSGCSPIGPVSP